MLLTFVHNHPVSAPKPSRNDFECLSEMKTVVGREVAGVILGWTGAFLHAAYFKRWIETSGRGAMQSSYRTYFRRLREALEGNADDEWLHSISRRLDRRPDLIDSVIDLYMDNERVLVQAYGSTSPAARAGTHFP